MWTQKKFISYAVFLFINSFITRTSPQAVNTTTKSSNINCGDWKIFHTSCYKVFQRFLYFHSAREFCQKHGGGELASIQNKDENDFIRNLVDSSAQYGEAWIGLRRTENHFGWTNNDELKYENWVIHRPTHNGHCTQMVRGGLWANVLCYNQMQFVCKKAPIIVKDNSRLYLILHISIPVACVSVMLLFVAFLFFKSYRELEDLKAKNQLANPFQIIQAAMELPTKQSDDFIQRSKGMTLWHSAIERIKTGNEKADSNNNNNTSNGNQIKNSLSIPLGSDLRIRDESVCFGTLGAPVVVPAIFVTENVDDNKNLKKTESLELKSSDTSNKELVKKASLSCPPALEGIRNNETTNNASSTEKIYKSEVGIWVKNKPNHSFKGKEPGDGKRKRAFSLNRKIPTIDQTEGDQNIKENGESRIYANNQLSNLVVVDVNVHTKPKERIADSSSSLDNDNSIVLENGGNLLTDKLEMDFNVGAESSDEETLDHPLREPKLFEAVVENPEVQEIETERKTHSYIDGEDRPFSEILRQESIRRRKDFFPGLQLDNDTKDRKPKPFTRYKFINGDYYKTTLV